MKKLLLSSIIAVSAVACNTSLDKEPAVATQQAVQQTMSDTTGLAAYNAWKAQNELASVEASQQTQAVTSAPRVRTIVKEVPVYTAPKRSTSSNNSSSNSTSSSENNSNSDAGSGTASTETTQPAEKKEGWSKAAKGAVIGGVAGAAGGAAINKKNRVLGAVIGGVVGAAGGYGIGRTMDKKDGRIEYNPYQ
jgi:hypothetical protein